MHLAQWVEALRTERRSLPTRARFGLRVALGRVCGLDRGSAGFVPVYQEADELLSRIANRTVMAFLHVSLVDRHPRLAVYPALLAAGGRAAARLAGR